MSTIVHTPQSNRMSLEGVSRSEPTSWICTELDCEECKFTEVELRTPMSSDGDYWDYEGPEPDDPLPPELTPEEERDWLELHNSDYVYAEERAADLAELDAQLAVDSLLVFGPEVQAGRGKRSRRVRRREHEAVLLKQMPTLLAQFPTLERRKKERELAKRTKRTRAHDWPAPKPAGAPYKLAGVAPYKKAKMRDTPAAYEPLVDESCHCKEGEMCLECMPSSPTRWDRYPSSPSSYGCDCSKCMGYGGYDSDSFGGW
jgi:hypothetical protein